MADPNIADLKRRMAGAIEALRRELSGLRTGRASANLLEPVTVEAYGSKMPIPKVATIGVPEPRLITVQVWDKGLVKTVEKAIRDAGLGLNPQVDGSLLRVPIPELNAERRKELSKIAHKYAEQARVAVRNVRRDGMDKLKHMERDGEVSEDEHHTRAGEYQKLTDGFIKEIDAALAKKEQEILQV